jgi:cystathionine beta-lyase/cystathionine gamma-synthase
MRLERCTQTTRTVIDYLKQHKRVEKVIFPFEENFPQYELAKQQMQGACGLLTFVIRATQVVTIEKFCNSLKHILMAVSWGGYESLIIPRCSGMPVAAFDADNVEHRMMRLYCGLEDAHYIIADLEQAFVQIEGLE